MKYLQAIIVITLFSFSLSAQNNRISVGVDAVHFTKFSGVFVNPGLTMEIATKTNWTLSMKMSYGKFTAASGSYMQDYLFQPEARYYLKGNMNGIYLGAGAAFSMFKKSYENSLESNFSWIGSVGWQAALTERLSINTRMNVGLKRGKRNFPIGVGIGLGYRF